MPFWPVMEAGAHTLAYEAEVMGPGNVLPAAMLVTVTQPTLVLNGENSPQWMISAGRAVSQVLPGAVQRILPDQAHDVGPQAIVPELIEFFTIV